LRGAKADMLTFVTRIPIFRRLFYAFLLAAIIPGIVIAILGAMFLNTVTTRNQAEQVNIDAMDLAYQGLPNLQGSHSLLTILYDNMYNHANPQPVSQEQLGEVSNYEQLFTTQLQQYQQQYEVATVPHMSQVRAILLANDPNNASLINDQQQTLQNLTSNFWPAYKQDLDQVLHSLTSAAPVTTATPLLTKATNDYSKVENAWMHVIQLSSQISRRVVQFGPAQINLVLLTVVIAFLITLTVVVTIGYIVNLTITKPLRDLASLTRRISKGETSARASISGHDEIYMVASSMNNMLDNIVHLIQEVQSQRDNLQAQVEKLVSEVSGVGEGDLRIQAEVTADALGVLADSFNYMVEELGSLVVRVKMVANEVEHSTASILDRMNQLVETGDMQIEQIEEAATEVERMAASSRQVAERTQMLYEVAREARRNAQVGRQAVQQAISGMGRINENVQVTAARVQVLGEHSREIEEIVTVISGIAHQTNRLALDAAIQAAMAGENGKGFGAVAADIRRLAERAKEQASNITHIVRNVREEIGAVAVAMQDTERETASGTNLTKEVAISLESIFSAVEQQARAIEAINALAGQQLQSSSSVVQVMHTVSESTRQSSLNTRDASQNMERLARLVEQLRSSVEAFKLREDQDYFPLNPNNANISLEDEPENQMSVSGLFRTVSASAHLPTPGSSNALPSPRADVFSYASSMPPLPGAQPPYSNGDGWGMDAMPLPPDQSWYGAPSNPNGNGHNGWGS
jgi:methyl-accepting chemotaxis protein